MPKPAYRLSTKCHSKTLHEIRERTIAGTRPVCTDCGQSIMVASV